MSQGEEAVVLWITRYADNDLLISVYQDFTIEVAPRQDYTRWDAPLPVRPAPGQPEDRTCFICGKPRQPGSEWCAEHTTQEDR